MGASSPDMALRQENWKFIRLGGKKENRSALYDLSSDPGETTDLSAREPARVAEMAERLHALLKEQGNGK